MLLVIAYCNHTSIIVALCSEKGGTMSIIGKYIKQRRREAGLTQEEFALRSGLGLRFVRELEQGKETVRMDKVNIALNMFGMEAVPGRIIRNDTEDL